jgi:hypothetical protein
MIVVAVGYFAVATFHVDVHSLAPGLDPSWVYAINELPRTGAIFGRDVVFSFGPLGHLLVPVDVGSNLVQAAAMAVTAWAAILAVALYHYRRHRRVAPLLVFIVALLFAPAVGLIYEYRLLVLLALLLSIPTEDRKVWRIAAGLAGVLAGILVFAKVSSGLAAIVMLGLASGAWIVRREVRVAYILAGVALPFVATIALLTLVLLGGFGTLLVWIGTAWEFSAGYSEAMSYPGPGSILLLVAGTIAVYAIAAILMSRRELRATPMALALGALVLLALRHGIVRHYGRFVPAIVLAALASLVLALGSRRATAIGLGALLIVTGLTLGMTAIESCMCTWRPDVMGPAQGLTSLSRFVQMPEARQDLARESSRQLADDRLPYEMVAAIRVAGGSVDVIPWEIAFTAANDLPWEPNPVLQTYSAFTSSLDLWTADHFASREAPESLLVQFTDIDARHPMAAAPAVWRTVLERYRPSGVPIASGPFGEVALFVHRQRPAEMRLQPMGETSAHIGERVEIPTSSHLVFGSLRLQHDLSGRLAGLLWRVDPLLLDLELADGGVITVRFLPSTARDGILLNRLPMTLEELVNLYAGTLPRELVALRIHGAGTSSFEPKFEVRWFEAQWRA